MPRAVSLPTLVLIAQIIFHFSTWRKKSDTRIDKLTTESPTNMAVGQMSQSKRVKVKFSRTRYQALGPELIPVYRQSARR